MPIIDAEPKELYYIHTKSSCDTRKVWYTAFRIEKECPGCGALHRKFRAGPIDVEVERKPDLSALNSVSPVPIGVMRVEFFRLIEEEARQCLHLGRVFDRRGNLLDGFVTFVSERPLIIRGSRESQRRTCEVCGRFAYFWAGEPYVLHSNLTGEPLYEIEPYGLALVPALGDKIDWRPWKKRIWVEKLPVRDTPLDGIEDFPANYY